MYRRLQPRSPDCATILESDSTESVAVFRKFLDVTPHQIDIGPRCGVTRSLALWMAADSGALMRFERLDRANPMTTWLKRF